MVKLTKAELKEARKMEWQEKQKEEERKALMNKILIWGGSILGIIAFVGALVWLASSPPSSKQAINVAEVSEKDIFKGPENAKVTLIEYSDFQCPACKAYFPNIKLLSEEYKNELKVVYRNFPLTSIHPNATIAGQAAYAAFYQGKFWEMHDLLFENQESWANEGNPKSLFEEYANEISLDIEKYSNDVESDETKKFVEDQRLEGLSAGVNSTPTFVLNGMKIDNPRTYDDFKKLIDEELKK